MSAMTSVIKETHNRYFDELEGIARCQWLLKEGGSRDFLIEELERRIGSFAEALKTGGIALVEEARK